ncbi:MAG TPA: Dabb family protein [Candidatus Microbacterium pullistercoris]|nr:Dabb family protein [Candidatus Microbacterium pullistercoris]
MITHIIRMAIRPDVTPDQVAAGLQRMAEASSQMGPEDGVTPIVFGTDVGDGFDFGAVSTLADLEAYEAMMTHPAHLEIDRVGLPLVSRFHSFDITDDPDPEVGRRIADIHRRRFTAHPDVLELVLGLEEYRGSGVPGRD